MKRILPQFLILAFLLLLLPLFTAQAQTTKKSKKKAPVVSAEDKRKAGLVKLLCKEKDLACDEIKSIFSDPRLVIKEPPPSAPPENPERPGKGSPYLTERYGLLTEASLARCRSFYIQHRASFDRAYKETGVPAEIICGHLRVETNFGAKTGKRPAIVSLVSLYVRKPTAKRQRFAFNELRALLKVGGAIADALKVDILDIPGSATGALGLMQCEPTTCALLGGINPFDPNDAIMGIARYLAILGFDENPKHQANAIELYYGKPKREQRKKHPSYAYYREAVLKYADAFSKYLENNPIIEIPIELPLQTRGPF